MFKVILLVFKSIHNIYSENLRLDYKLYNCRPDDFLMLQTKKVKTKHGCRKFDYAGPRLWNALPLKVRTAETVDDFKSKLKTILFTDAERLKRRAFQYT